MLPKEALGAVAILDTAREAKSAPKMELLGLPKGGLDPLHLQYQPPIGGLVEVRAFPRALLATLVVHKVPSAGPECINFVSSS